MALIRHNEEGDNQNQDMLTKPHYYSSTSSELKYESDTPSEVKHIEWKLKNISRGINVAKIAQPNRIIDAIRFTAGNNIDMSSDWEIMLRYDDDWLGIVVCLLDYKGNSENLLAEFTVSLKFPDGSIYRSVKCDMKDWKLANTSNMLYITSTTSEEFKMSNVIVDDAFTIYMDFTICRKNRVVTSPMVDNEKSMTVVREEIRRQFEMLLEDGTCSDFTIKIPKPGGESDGYETFQVHKGILAARSSVFNAMVEANMQETKTGEVEITDVSPLAMKILLKFIYTGILDDEWILRPEEVILAADKYHLATMKDICEKNLAQVLTPSNAFQMMKLSKMLNLQKASKLVMEYIKSNVSDIHDKA